MALDPTLEEMTSYLKNNTPPSLRWEGFSDDCMIAAYWFASHYYCGSGSNLYAALCGVPYNPKDVELEEEHESVQELYVELQTRFAA